MRFKISTHPPLPAAKAWCPLPTSDSDPSPTVRSLKTHLVRSFPTVRAYSATVDELVLEVDGFELLDGSALADLTLTGGDVIEYVRVHSKPFCRMSRLILRGFVLVLNSNLACSVPARKGRPRITVRPLSYLRSNLRSRKPHVYRRHTTSGAFYEET